MPQPNPIQQSNLPGVTIGDTPNTSPGPTGPPAGDVPTVTGLGDQGIQWTWAGGAVVLGSLADHLQADSAQDPSLPNSATENFGLGPSNPPAGQYGGTVQTVGVWLTTPPPWMDTNARILTPGLYTTGLLAFNVSVHTIPTGSGLFVSVSGNIGGGVFSLDALADAPTIGDSIQGYIETFALGPADVPFLATMGIVLPTLAGADIAIVPFIQRLAH